MTHFHVCTTGTVRPTTPASTERNTFQSFSLRVHLLVSMLLSLEGPQGMEFNCCSHVDRLLSKLPQYYRDGFKVHCLFCDSKDHFIGRCPNIKVQSTAELDKWITEGKHCWKCARGHAPESCNLKKPCSECGDIHLQVLHNIAQCRSTDLQSRTSESRVYLTPSLNSNRVLLKVVPVLLHSNSNSIETYAVLDDGAPRTMILPTAIQQLNGEAK